MSTSRVAKETEYAYLFDPVGGAPRDIVTTVVSKTTYPPGVFFDYDSALPKAKIRRVERRDGELITVGKEQVLSGTVQIEIVPLDGKCTLISLFPQYSKPLLKLINGFNPKALMQVEEAIQTPAVAVIQMYQNQLLVGLIHKTVDNVYWYDTPRMEYEGTPVGIDFLSRKQDSKTIVEMLLLTLKSGKKTYSLVSGVRLHKQVNKKLERELLNLPSSQYTWDVLNEIIEPFLVLRSVDQFGNLTIY